VGLSPGIFGCRKINICKNILNPLIPSIKTIIVYELKDERKELENLKPYLKFVKGRHELDMEEKSWDFFIKLLYKPSLLSTINEIRGSILIKCINMKIAWERIFKYCTGPHIIGNASVGTGKTAIQYARRNFDEKHVYISVDKVNSGLDFLTIMSSQDIIENIFDFAANICQLPKHERYDLNINSNAN
jgi:hypothetical protein